MRVLVCGGRQYGNPNVIGKPLAEVEAERLNVYETLDAIDGISEIIQGGGAGADEVADQYAIQEGLERRTFKADWEKHGRAAGPIRNQLMLDEGKPKRVVAFPGGRGTADMVRRAKRAGIEVQEVQP